MFGLWGSGSHEAGLNFAGAEVKEPRIDDTNGTGEDDDRGREGGEDRGVMDRSDLPPLMLFWATGEDGDRGEVDG